VQKERFKSLAEYERLKTRFIVTKELVAKKAGKKTIIMHPLPRVGEINPEIDDDPRAVYLSTQVRNGMYVRMALLSLVLKGS
jgi:aspartate carbamoyltransferase catalytic subunit